MSGPYFLGQQSSPCGHYYPDVLRLRDEKRPGRKFVRILICRFCGKYELPLEARTLNKELQCKLNKEGFDAGVKEEEISEVRKKELKRLASEGKHKQRALLKLQSILEEAIHGGADSVELEYVAEGLEVTYMFGNRGSGWVLADRMLESEIVEVIVECARLHNKSHGVMDWTFGGKSHRIEVEEHENFGESAFRLILEKPRRRRAKPRSLSDAPRRAALPSRVSLAARAAEEGGTGGVSQIVSLLAKQLQNANGVLRLFQRCFNHPTPDRSCYPRPGFLIGGVFNAKYKHTL